MGKAVENLQTIEGVPNFVSSLLSIVDPDKWSRQHQRLSVQAAGIELTRQKDQLDLARKAEEFSRRDITRSLAAGVTLEQLTGKTNTEIQQAIATEAALGQREIAEKTRELEALNLGQLGVEIKKGEKSNFKSGRLEERFNILTARQVALDSAKISLDVGNIQLAKIHKNNFYNTLSINELGTVIEDMTEKGEKVLEFQPGLEVSLEELKQLQVKKQAAVTVQGELLVKNALETENAQTASLLFGSQNERALVAGIITPEVAEANRRFAEITFGGSKVGASAASEAIDKRTADLEKQRKEFIKQQPIQQRAVWKRWLDTGETKNDMDNANWVATELVSTSLNLPPRGGKENIYNFLGDDVNIFMREALTGGTGKINIEAFNIQDALSALTKQTGKIDLSIHLGNAVEQSNARKIHTGAVGGKLVLSAVKELARTSPQFAQLLTIDGEDFRQDFIVADTIDTDKILSTLAMAEVELSRTPEAQARTIDVSYVAALIEKIKNPQHQGSFTDKWNKDHDSLVEQSFIMFLTGGNVLRGVDGYNRDLRDRGAAAIQQAREQAEAEASQARTTAKMIELIGEQPDVFGQPGGGG